MTGDSDPVSPTEWLEDARGLPFVCLWQDWHLDDAGTVVHRGGISLPPRAAVPAGAPGLAYRGLPIRPIWPALLINIAFYALLFWLCVRIIKAIRGWRRFNRGLCPRCAYDLAFDYSRGCHECGRGVKRAIG